MTFTCCTLLLIPRIRRASLPRLIQNELLATCGSIRLKLLKIGARVTIPVRRIKIAFASACPFQDTFALAHARLPAPPQSP